MAFDLSLGALDKRVATLSQKKTSEETRMKLLMEVHRVWQHGVKSKLQVRRINRLLSAAYKTCIRDKVGNWIWIEYLV